MSVGGGVTAVVAEAQRIGFFLMPKRVLVGVMMKKSKGERRVRLEESPVCRGRCWIEQRCAQTMIIIIENHLGRRDPDN